MAQLSDRLNRSAPSETLAMSQKNSEMKAQGINVINMGVGEPDFMTPDHAKEAGKKAIDDNFSKYSPVPGYPALREAISKELKDENNLDYAASEIIVGTGGKQGVCNTVSVLVNPGDEVLIPAPYWVSCLQMVKLAGGVPVIVSAGVEQDFKITAEQLEEAITPKTKMIVLYSPSSPTGSVYTTEELETLSKVVLTHEDAFVLSGETYEHISYIDGHSSIASCFGMKERTTLYNGVSKAYAMTDWRIGWVTTPEWIVKGLNKLQGQYTSGTCNVSQMAAAAAYVEDQSCVTEYREIFRRRCDLIVSLAKEIPGLEVNVSQGAFYLFLKCSSFFGKTDSKHVVNSSSDLAMYVLEEGCVATVGGNAFDAPDRFRMNYTASDENIKEALRRIEEVLLKPK